MFQIQITQITMFSIICLLLVCPVSLHVQLCSKFLGDCTIFLATSTLMYHCAVVILPIDIARHSDMLMCSQM